MVLRGRHPESQTPLVFLYNADLVLPQRFGVILEDSIKISPNSLRVRLPDRGMPELARQKQIRFA
uniref:hypothetical protein n=1 Tax=Pseudomonas fluorescens TaxID=294 RepID=UPI00155D9101|nr:hypothetical protein [Pseudomonas fluorescens]